MGHVGRARKRYLNALMIKVLRAQKDQRAFGREFVPSGFDASILDILRELGKDKRLMP